MIGQNFEKSIEVSKSFASTYSGYGSMILLEEDNECMIKKLLNFWNACCPGWIVSKILRS